MRIVIVTGMSGAGKSSALNLFEDMGYYCIDNLPPLLIENFLDLVRQSGKTLDRVALGVDIRGGDFFEGLLSTVETLREEAGIDLSVLFLTANDQTLVRRYKEHRRPHPMDKAGNIFDGIQREKAILSDLRMAADEVVDTTTLSLGQLKEIVDRLYLPEGTSPNLQVSVISFGFKNGILLDADLVFDVRFMRNPYYIPELRDLTGLDAALVDYVSGFPETRAFLEKATDMISFLMPLYVREGKRTLTIGIGCTGGRHRSVAIAEMLGAGLSVRGEVHVSHRDRGLWK